MRYKAYKKPPTSKKSIIAQIILGFLCVPFVFCLGVMIYCNSFLEYYPISGESMKPLFNPNGINEDYAYVNFDKDHIEYNDIIVYERGTANSPHKVIKRVIAKGGDNFMIKRNQDGEYAIFIQYSATGDFLEIEENFISDKTVYSTMYTDFYNKGTGKNFEIDKEGNKFLHIEQDEVFYLGDNRTDSNDCIDYGAQKTQNIVGEVVFLVRGNNNRMWQVILQILGINRWK